MKKLFALILAVLMIASLSVIGFAAEVDGGTTGDVNVNVTDKNGNQLKDEDVTDIYYIVVSWNKLNFTFVTEQSIGDLKWDAENHKYANLVGQWKDADNDGSVITITNHSNATVNISAAFANDSKTSDVNLGVTAALTNGDKTLQSAVGTTVANAPYTTYTVSVNGTPTMLETYKVDTVTVTISK